MEQPAIETRLNRLSLRQLANFASHNFSVQRRIKKKKKANRERKSEYSRRARDSKKYAKFSAMGFVDREFLQTDSHDSYATVDSFY